MRRGSLNEITILEHEQFIEDAGGGRTASGLLFASGEGRSSAELLLDDDSGDSSDYFCGVSLELLVSRPLLLSLPLKI